MSFSNVSFASVYEGLGGKFVRPKYNFGAGLILIMFIAGTSVIFHVIDSLAVLQFPFAVGCLAIAQGVQRSSLTARYPYGTCISKHFIRELHHAPESIISIQNITAYTVFRLGPKWFEISVSLIKGC
jgi:hypothetical protein